MVFNPDQLLYHGTTNLNAKIITRYGGIRIIKREKGGVDFGPGFYVTVGKERQALEWAKFKAKYPTYIGEIELGYNQMSIHNVESTKLLELIEVRTC